MLDCAQSYGEVHIDDFIPARRYAMPAADLIAYVCDLFKISIPEFMGDGRDQYLVGARMVVSVILREERGLSYPVIGRICGGKDHSSIVHHVKVFRDKCKVRKGWFAAYERARKAFLA